MLDTMGGAAEADSERLGSREPGALYAGCFSCAGVYRLGGGDRARRGATDWLGGDGGEVERGGDGDVCPLELSILVEAWFDSHVCSTATGGIAPGGSCPPTTTGEYC